MRAIVSACVAAACALVAPCALGASAPLRAGSATASVGDGTATLTNGRITRSWLIGSTSTTTVLRRGRNGANWSNGASPDFSLTLDGVPTSSVRGWTLGSVTARREPGGPGVQLVFDYGLDPVGLVTLERMY